MRFQWSRFSGAVSVTPVSALEEMIFDDQTMFTFNCNSTFVVSLKKSFSGAVSVTPVSALEEMIYIYIYTCMQ